MLTPTSGTLADYNSAILNGNATHMRIVFPVQGITLTDSDISADGGVTLSTVLNPETDMTMGMAVSTEIVMHLLNSSVFVGFDWTEEFHVDFGVDISGTTNWVTVGYFTGSKLERRTMSETIEFTAYDRMQKFDVLADTYLSTITYPATMQSIYQGLCTYLGIGYVSGDEDASTMAMSYSESPFVPGITCRTLLSYIAEANGCYAKITADGNMKLMWFADQTSAYSVDADDYFDINIDEADAPAVQVIRVACTYDENVSGFVYPVGGSGEPYQILDNPLLLVLSTANITTVLTNMLARFTAFGAYRPATMNITGNWMVEAGDIIEIADPAGNTYDMPIFGRTLVWGNGNEDTYECTGKTSRDELSQSAREQYSDGGMVANKYTIRSGVDITDEGVTISGGKYLKLISGGVLDVQATNFIIDSVNKYIKAGNWRFDDSGMSGRKISGNNKIDFIIGKNTIPSDSTIGMYINMAYKTVTGIGIPLPYITLGVKDGNAYDYGMGVQYELIAGGNPSIHPVHGKHLDIGSVDDPVDIVHAKAFEGTGCKQFGQVVSLGTINDSSLTITFSATVDFILLAVGSGNARCHAFLCRGRASSSPAIADLGGGGNITATASGNNIKVTTSTAYDAKIYALVISGNTYDIS